MSDPRARREFEGTKARWGGAGPNKKCMGKRPCFQQRDLIRKQPDILAETEEQIRSYVEKTQLKDTWMSANLDEDETMDR